MSQIYISIGSNINRNHYINTSLNALEQVFGEIIISSIYESEAVGFEGENFYNLVAGAKTDMPMSQVVEILKKIEDDNGRVRGGERFSARTLDLDLLTYDDLITDSPAQIPRDEITKNAFVLWPLAEIAPQELLPGTDTTYSQLWDNYDQNKQKLWTVPFQRSSNN